jgi:hypothetical protein
MTRSSVRRSPFSFLGVRPYREPQLRAYLIREHRRGRPLREILDDPAVERLGGRALCLRITSRAETIAELERDVREAIENCHP